ncbi:unnamed protein product [Effrenium voratum]|uniref:Uncharacterized protein n=1 Tax=Effrenium voratum TaxID=2562239 RepID=A0AA36IRY1_9DINO|nr:unnamed protein product [Effrenium voratum]
MAPRRARRWLAPALALGLVLAMGEAFAGLRARGAPRSWALRALQPGEIPTGDELLEEGSRRVGEGHD